MFKFVERSTIWRLAFSPTLTFTIGVYCLFPEEFELLLALVVTSLLARALLTRWLFLAASLSYLLIAASPAGDILRVDRFPCCICFFINLLILGPTLAFCAQTEILSFEFGENC